MAKLNKTCIICGDKYSYCPNCRSKQFEPSWKNSFCSDNCKEIYDICVASRDNKITTDEANARLQKCDLNKPNLEEDFKARIEKIKGSKNSEKKNDPEIKEKKLFKKEEN